MRNNPDLDAVLTCRFPGFERRPKESMLAPYRLLAATARDARAAGSYDAAVVLRFDHWWGAWLAAAAGIPRRIGYDLPETRPFLTQPLPYRTDRHEVEQNATLAGRPGTRHRRSPGSAALLPSRNRSRPGRRAGSTRERMTPVERAGRDPPGRGRGGQTVAGRALGRVATGWPRHADAGVVLTGGARPSASLAAAIAAQLAPRL